MSEDDASGDDEITNHCESDPFPGRVVCDGGRRFDEIYTALADQRRRFALYHLREEERASLTDVAAQIGAWERDCPVGDVPNDTRADIETALYHHHLPKLQEGGVIEYDDRSGTLVFRDPHELAELCLEYCAPRERPT